MEFQFHGPGGKKQLRTRTGRLSVCHIYAYNLLRVLLASPSTNRVFRVISAGLIMRQEDVYQN
jgi:hypothetical protein